MTYSTLCAVPREVNDLRTRRDFPGSLTAHVLHIELEEKQAMLLCDGWLSDAVRADDVGRFMFTGFTQRNKKGTSAHLSWSCPIERKMRNTKTSEFTGTETQEVGVKMWCSMFPTE